MAAIAHDVLTKKDSYITLEVTGGYDADTGVKSYHIYTYENSVSGTAANAEFKESKWVYTLRNLTGLPCRLLDDGANAELPSYDEANPVTYTIRDHHHYDHIYKFEWDGWHPERWYTFWVMAEDYSGNYSVTASGLGYALRGGDDSDYYEGGDSSVECLEKHEDLKAKFEDNGWASYCLLENFCSDALHNVAADGNPCTRDGVYNYLTLSGTIVAGKAYTYTSNINEIDSGTIDKCLVYIEHTDGINLSYDDDWIKVYAIFSGTTSEIEELVYQASGVSSQRKNVVKNVGVTVEIEASTYVGFGYKVEMASAAGAAAYPYIDRIGVYVNPENRIGIPDIPDID